MNIVLIGTQSPSVRAPELAPHDMGYRALGNPDPQETASDISRSRSPKVH